MSAPLTIEQVGQRGCRFRRRREGHEERERRLSLLDPRSASLTSRECHRIAMRRVALWFLLLNKQEQLEGCPSIPVA
jgi:hypothetical protein